MDYNGAYKTLREIEADSDIEQIDENDRPEIVQRALRRLEEVAGWLEQRAGAMSDPDARREDEHYIAQMRAALDDVRAHMNAGTDEVWDAVREAVNAADRALAD